MSLPDDDRAFDALRAVQSLDPAALQRRIHDEVGDSMLGVFAGVVKALFPGDDKEAAAKKVHLMVLAHLMRGELERTAAPRSTKPRR